MPVRATIMAPMKGKEPSQQSIEAEFRASHPNSMRLYEQAKALFPGGVTHDGRYSPPTPIYAKRGKGSRKWDVDGVEYVDYWMGHGALLLGHAHPSLIQAIEGQILKGTHLGACHELEIDWAQAILRLVPSVERVRFTSSGTEAVQMALRLARAVTGKPKIVKLADHFHGWSNDVAPGEAPPGIVGGTRDEVLTAPANDLSALDALLARGDVAALILEPSGAHMGAHPLGPGYLREARDATSQRGVFLIFDEVVTGFRWSQGGVQGLLGLKPDITTFGKIVAGGLPGGAVGGSVQAMAPLEFGDPEWMRRHHILHPGTFNANPLSAAAGVAMLSLIGDGKAQRRAAETAREIAKGMNRLLMKHSINGCVRGQSSILHLCVGPDAPSPEEAEALAERGEGSRFTSDRALVSTLRQAMLLHGVDLMGGMMIVSAVHDEGDVAQTHHAFEQALLRVKAQGLIG